MMLKISMKKLKKKSPKLCKEIATHLDELCSFLDKAYNINNGGCCWVAYCIAKMLYNSGFRIDIGIISYDSEIDVENIKELDESYSHYYVILNGIPINISDFEESNSYVLQDVNPNDILEHYKSEEWCCNYDHRKNSIVYKMLKTYYFDLLNDLRKEE